MQPVETRLVTNPAGAWLEIDGDPSQACIAPCSFPLSVGRHTLAATMDGYRKALRIFEVPTDSDIFVNLDRATGTVAIRSEPQGAMIYIDGHVRPERTPAVLRLPTGEHVVEIVRNDERQRDTITVRESGITNLAARFDQ
jgi:hypothetical protein